MHHTEDDRQFIVPQELKGLSHEQLRERADKLFAEIEQKKREGKIRPVIA
jgi:hypothetical protein